MHDGFHEVGLPGKGPGIGGIVHGDRGSDSIVIEAVCGGLSEAGRLGRGPFTAIGVPILRDVNLENAGRAREGGRIRRGLGMPPLIQHPPTVHADRHNTDDDHQADQQPHRNGSSAATDIVLDARMKHHFRPSQCS